VPSNRSRLLQLTECMMYTCSTTTTYNYCGQQLHSVKSTYCSLVDVSRPNSS